MEQEDRYRKHMHTQLFIHPPGTSALAESKLNYSAACSPGSLSRVILKLMNSVKYKGNLYYFLNFFFSFS